MYYSEIKKTDIANGEGVRVSLFVSGCTHHCDGCFNMETWDFSFGRPFTKATEDELLSALSPSYIAGLSLLGGEPMEPENQKALLPFLKRMKTELPDKNLWIYSGYIYDKDFVKGGRAFCEATDEILKITDVLVDGPFIKELADISLEFRGSSNQRILRLN